MEDAIVTKDLKWGMRFVAVLLPISSFFLVQLTNMIMLFHFSRAAWVREHSPLFSNVYGIWEYSWLSWGLPVLSAMLGTLIWLRFVRSLGGFISGIAALFFLHMIWLLLWLYALYFSGMEFVA